MANQVQALKGEAFKASKYFDGLKRDFESFAMEINTADGELAGWIEGIENDRQRSTFTKSWKDISRLVRKEISPRMTSLDDVPRILQDQQDRQAGASFKKVRAFTEAAKEADKLMREIENGLGDAELGLKKLADVMRRGLGDSPGAKKLEGARARAAKHVSKAQTATFVLDSLAAMMQKVIDKHRAGGSFKGAVPGNLGDNTKPSTPESQQYAVDLLKQGGILPEDENAADYPVLTASVKRDIIATLLKRKQPRLATWASRNLRTGVRAATDQQIEQFRQEAASAGDMAAVKIADKALAGDKAALREVEQMIRAAEGSTRRPVRAAKNYAQIVFLQNDHDFNDFRGSGGKGQDGFFDSDEKEMLRYLQQWDYGDNYGDIVDPMQQKGSGDSVYKQGQHLMTYNPGLGYAGLYVKASVSASAKVRK